MEGPLSPVPGEYPAHRRGRDFLLQIEGGGIFCEEPYDTSAAERIAINLPDLLHPAHHHPVPRGEDGHAPPVPGAAPVGPGPGGKDSVRGL